MWVVEKYVWLEGMCVVGVYVHMWVMCVVDGCGFGWCVAGWMWVVEGCGWLWGVSGVVGGVWVVTGV